MSVWAWGFNHLFRDCLQSFANRLKANKMAAWPRTKREGEGQNWIELKKWIEDMTWYSIWFGSFVNIYTTKCARHPPEMVKLLSGITGWSRVDMALFVESKWTQHTFSWSGRDAPTADDSPEIILASLVSVTVSRLKQACVFPDDLTDFLVEPWFLIGEWTDYFWRSQSTKSKQSCNFPLLLVSIRTHFPTM